MCVYIYADRAVRKKSKGQFFGTDGLMLTKKKSKEGAFTEILLYVTTAYFFIYFPI